jgi:hypothetical protein
LTGACFDLSDYFELGRKRSQIGGVDRIAVARGAGKGGHVAIGGDGLGKNSTSGVEQACCFVSAWSDRRRVVFDYAACVFES